MQDNDEGFQQQAPFQLIEYNYQPCSRIWTSENKSYASTLKKNNHLMFIGASRLINTSIHDEWFKSLHSESHKNVVFTATPSTSIKFTEQNLKFYSNMESGNMELASRKKNNQYELFMKPDTNTKAHFQWFYFKVTINKANKIVKFVLKNFIKATMLYSKGLKPFCRSLRNPDFHQFRQIETPVKFSLDPETDYYQLQFYHNFEYDRDEVQFCSQPPYTLNHLSKFIETIRCKKLTLGKTVIGTKIPYIIFQAKKQTKVVAMAMARQHPGETVGSWMMEGLINQISEKKGFDYITWVIIPMVNIDGVVMGNNRTGVLGHDFNRNWASDQLSMAKNSKLFPEITGIVTLIKSLKRKYYRKVKMFLDLHGHSSQPNVFTYGPPHEQQSDYFFQCRLFPQLLSKKNQNFKLDQSSYVVNPEKRKTARAVIFYNLGVPFTYTIQSTFGVMNGRNVGIDDFLQIGHDIGQCANEFLSSVVVKDSNQGQDSLLQEIKIKYADARNEGEEYDSASEASDQDPNRKQIQELVLLGQAQESSKKSARYHDKSLFSQKDVRKKSAIKTNQMSIQKETERNLHLLSKSTKTQKKRMNTQGQLLARRKECIFPNISTKNGRMSFDEGQFETSEQILKNLKVNEIQKRLHKLRNSKLGKKILIINAYSS